MTAAKFKPVADSALLVEFGTEISDTTNRSVLALDRVLASEEIEGVNEVVPAFVNLLVTFDPAITDHERVKEAIRLLLTNDPGEPPIPRRHRALVCYEGSLAPDLDGVAHVSDMSVEAVINAHLAGEYRVFMYGFAPGYAYLAGVPEPIQVPRKPTPIRDIAAGSILIAGPQCLITTLVMPTGWSIIGRSPTQVLTDDPDRPFLFDVGDEVVFERVDLATYERLSKEG